MGGVAKSVPKLEITLRIVNFEHEYRIILRDLSRRNIRNIILDLEPEETQIILKMALQLGMINSSYHFILTTLVSKSYFVNNPFTDFNWFVIYWRIKDVETINLEDYKFNRANITALRLIKTDSAFYKSILLNLTDYNSNNLHNNDKNKVLSKVLFL